ncbi:hypothetical protein BT93_C1366 [Corymbia citriodora subsp. variegata]|nr:hypothetical protein BT93_C1366 [Corymbia citriodora subsp. variegata]
MLDRFISICSAMYFDYTHSLLNGGKNWKKPVKLLAGPLDMNRSPILAFKNKSLTPVELIPKGWLSPTAKQSKFIKPCRLVPKTCQRMLDAPHVLDDYHLNLLDQGANNVVVIALLETVYLWNASNGSITELVTFDNKQGPVTSVSWAPDGRHIAIGLQNSHGKQLASGGNDNLPYLWDRSRASWNSGTQWLHKIGAHTSAVKALAWCPFQSNLLALGGSERCIKFWNTCTGACLNSVDIGSQVCSLLWSKRVRKLLRSRGLTENQLTLWKYPSTRRMVELTGHTSRVFLDECIVASAGADERLMFWQVFRSLEAAKLAPKTSSEPFAHWRGIR